MFNLIIDNELVILNHKFEEIIIGLEVQIFGFRKLPLLSTQWMLFFNQKQQFVER